MNDRARAFSGEAEIGPREENAASAKPCAFAGEFDDAAREDGARARRDPPGPEPADRPSPQAEQGDEAGVSRPWGVSDPSAISCGPDRDAADSTDILIIVHQAHSTPGRIGERLARRGYRLDVRRPALGDPLPDTLSSYAGAVVFGGPMSANDDLPFIRAEIDFIEKALAAEAPLLGICLGAQMMAKALGAQVSPHREGSCEIGYYPLAATDTGAALLSWPSHVYHWHSEGFDLPRDADLLATGEVFPNQAFRYGEAAYGLQFHPEVTREMMCLWTVRGAHNLTKRGAQPGEAHLEGWSRYDAAVCRWLDGFLDVWLTAERMPGNGAPKRRAG